MTKRKLALLSGAAVVALGAAGTASAFDRVDWSWDKDVIETITKVINIDVSFDPTGMLELELSQIFIGDSVANARMHDVNNIPEPERELREFEFTASGTTSGSLDVEVAGTLLVPVVIPLDALAELPKFENTATALGNNASIESDRMVELHSGQFVFGDGDVERGEEGADFGVAALYGHLEHAGINTNQSAATALTAAAITDVIDPSVIRATATMYNVSKGQMANTATALANNLSVNLEAATDGDAVLVGDVTQFAFADVYATAYMHDVSVQNYNNLGALDGALFSNVATSIGNNLSISVSGPNVNIPNGGGAGGE